MKILRNKIVIIGSGHVGATILYTLLSSGSIAEIVMLDINKNKAHGEALDGSHATAFAYSPNIQVRSGDYSDCADAGIIVMTAGPSATPDKPIDRTELAKTNIQVTKSVMEQIIQYTKEALIIFVSNPVDILTYYAQNNFDYPKEKIFGSGTFLDTARFRRILSQYYLVDSKNVHGYILGEHGQTAFATWSNTNIAGIPFAQLAGAFPGVDLNPEEIVKTVKEVGWEVIQNKGFTNFGIAKSVERIIHSILSNELSILPLSSTINQMYGIDDVSLSVPCILSKDGISKQLRIPLNAVEEEQMITSANFLKKVYKSLF
ncbi:MAG: L-lactate dehydrogenase [Vallitaleaceae bacterium]|jgi:L-lactate dehydrogenase|nr:L-lactate dehydrogenase [Vallitaleaceae bacterium]